jgi:hypothetical protein
MDDLREHKKEALRMAAEANPTLPCEHRCALPHKGSRRPPWPICRRFWTQLSARQVLTCRGSMPGEIGQEPSCRTYSAEPIVSNP